MFKKKVLIFGTGSSSIEFYGYLNLEKVEIIAFIDSNPLKKNTFFLERYKILSPKDIKNVYYDVIIVASVFQDEISSLLIKENVPFEKIIYYKSEYYEDFLKEQMMNLELSQFTNKSQDIELIATGLSYVRDGLDLSILKKKAFNFGFSSQDLFSDYYILNSILKHNRVDNLKYILLGVSYFSFSYDLSKSINSYLTPRYYGLTKTMRSYQVQDEYFKFRNIAELALDYEQDVNKAQLKYQNNKYYEVISNKDKQEGKRTALRHSSKSYPLTIDENKAIFNQILKLCESHGVLPIVVVFPVTSYYFDFLTKGFEQKFLDLISEYQKEYKFLYLDYLKDTNFKDDDFWDATHLNFKGAKKLTEKLNEVLHKLKS
ncbi:hypothetical protein B1B04_01115 [Lysinibacillus sp. KCTC 33748]|uniref:nucleoside-diphosphate sugar epimerase/dehydratase n=1 Tax=unclassified Lysinibacillus TaxID=2636778 RepID=UPI0009A8B93E|nr:MULTISPECIES: hypothetical protein [unclassified Lysinibacillus]OXS77032.1 hypothetical protein B1B04_01115 [Lysinibacillus sp. KCTC 33748]SKB29044.1 hypothetical protein SAMN06295926_101229 [Lysinibacillus sp. AC-3]